MASKWAKTFAKNLVTLGALPSNEDEVAELVDAVRSQAPDKAWESMATLGSDVMMYKIGAGDKPSRAIIYINDAEEVARFAAIVEQEVKP